MRQSPSSGSRRPPGDGRGNCRIKEEIPRLAVCFAKISVRASIFSHPLSVFRSSTRPSPGGRWLPIFLIFAAFLFPAHADITGTVTLSGKPNSKDETFVAAANTKGCGESPIRHTENWKIGAKGELGDVVIWIIDPKFKATVSYKVPDVVLKQLGCRYVPHVIAVRAGTPFQIVNGDPTLHNIRAKTYDGPGTPPGTDVFNFGQMSRGQTDSRQFDDAGIYTLQCDVHSWMQAWVMVLPKADFPADAVTGTDGTFKLVAGDILQDGDYKIDAWHPRFAQPLEQMIHVKNGTAHADFVFDGAKSF